MTLAPRRRLKALAYIGLGSNLGDRRKTIREAVRRIGRLPGVRVLRCSRLRETAPVGKTDQPRFLNGVAEISTRWEPAALLSLLHGIENKLGRVRATRWGPRSIDLDLLLWGERIVDRKRLSVPHPRLTERSFVLEPLAELCPRLEVPGTGRTVETLLRDLERNRT